MSLALASSAGCLVSFSGPYCLSANWPCQLCQLINSSDVLDCPATAILAIAAKTIPQWLKQAATHGVATACLSTIKISNVATFYYLNTLLHVHSFVREKMWWWLAFAREKMWWWIVSFGYFYHKEVLQYCLSAVTLAAGAKLISQQQMQAAHGVVMVWSSANKFPMQIYMIIERLTVLRSLFVRVSWLWHVLLPRLDSYSYFGDTLQNGKQLLSVRFPLMTKYCVVRECKNILCGYLSVLTTVFSQQDDISIF